MLKGLGFCHETRELPSPDASPWRVQELCQHAPTSIPVHRHETSANGHSRQSASRSPLVHGSNAHPTQHTGQTCVLKPVRILVWLLIATTIVIPGWPRMIIHRNPNAGHCGSEYHVGGPQPNADPPAHIRTPRRRSGDERGISERFDTFWDVRARR